MLYRDYLKSKYQNTAVKLANAEGVPCVLEYSKGKNMRNYEVYGNSVQDGTPSPESPVEIQSVGDLVTDTESEYYGKYDIPITVTGKNLFNKEDCHRHEIKSEPPTVIDINTYAAGVLWSDQLISLFKPNTTYTISCEFECVDVPSDDYTFSNGILGFLIQSKVSGYSSINMLVTHQLVKGEIYHFSKTFTVPSNFSEGTYIMYVYRNSYKNSDGKSITASAICRNIQIEEGTSSTAYEPYKGSETTHIYLDEPLRKVGDYADYIDFKNQKVVRKIEVLDDTGTKTISESFGTLLTPTEENISLPSLKTFKGTNVISVDTTVLPSNIKAKFIRT